MAAREHETLKSFHKFGPVCNICLSVASAETTDCKTTATSAGLLSRLCLRDLNMVPMGFERLLTPHGMQGVPGHMTHHAWPPMESSVRLMSFSIHFTPTTVGKELAQRHQC